MKRLLGLAFICICFISGLAIAENNAQQPAKEEPPAAAAPRPTGINIPVLCYHRVLLKSESIYDFTPDQLRTEFELLKKEGYHPITALRMVELLKSPEKLPSKPIVLTFDDGNKSHYTEVFPLLKEFGWEATFFVYPSDIGETEPQLLTWSELREMAGAGMDIESHTMTHPFLTLNKPSSDRKAYFEWLNKELLDSRLVIEKHLGRPVELLAYPFGWFDEQVEQQAMNSGYKAAFTVNWGVTVPGDNPWRIKRHVMENTMDSETFERIVSARPLRLEILSPRDLEDLSEPPAIRFRILNPGISTVDVQVRNSKRSLTPDEKGVYDFGELTGLKPGFYMVIVKARLEGQPEEYVGTWGFNYMPAPDAVALTPSNAPSTPASEGVKTPMTVRGKTPKTRK